MIQFGLVVCLHFGIGLPTVVDVAYSLNLFLVEHHECLLRLVGLDGAIVLVPSAQIHKEHLVLTVAQLPAIAYATLLVLIQNPKGYARICGIEHLTRQDEDSLHLIVTYQLLAYGQCVFILQRTIAQQEAGNAVRRIEVIEHVQNPGIVGIAHRGQAITAPADVLCQLLLSAPCFEVERRIGHDVVGTEVGMLVVGE